MWLTTILEDVVDGGLCTHRTVRCGHPGWVWVELFNFFYVWFGSVFVWCILSLGIDFPHYKYKGLFDWMIQSIKNKTNILFNLCKCSLFWALYQLLATSFSWIRVFGYLDGFTGPRTTLVCFSRIFPRGVCRFPGWNWEHQTLDGPVCACVLDDGWLECRGALSGLHVFVSTGLAGADILANCSPSCDPHPRILALLCGCFFFGQDSILVTWLEIKDVACRLSRKPGAHKFWSPHQNFCGDHAAARS